MAESKIIWSNRAIKRLYGIFEFHISKNKSKEYPAELYRSLRKEIRLLKKHPGLGLRTTDKNILGFTVNNLILFYEPGERWIIIHTIRDNRQSVSGL